jgi:outer membrane protein assembly factor BamB
MPRIVLPIVTTVYLLTVLAPLSAADRAVKPEAERIDVAPTDWAWWRGPSHDGVAAPGQKPPLHWSETENVVWKVPVPGRGHGSPIVVGDQVFLATCDEDTEVQAVICYDRQSGAQVWKTDVHHGNITKGENAKGSQASATVACDGPRLFITFQNSKAIYLTALSRAGKQLWQKKVSDFVSHQGYGASPAIYKSLVLVSADHKGGGKLAAFDRASGELAWSHERPKIPNYTSPVVVNAAGKEQLIYFGCKLVSSFDPLTGKSLWEVPGATEECVTSTVTNGDMIFTSGGYPKNHIAAVRADGSGKVVWENGVRVYVPSLLIKDGYLYASADGGIAYCWEAATGKEMWKQRLDGDFTASPVLVGDDIFATNEAGKTFIFKAKPDRFEKVAENKLGDNAMATPAICGSRVYMRVASHKDSRRRETLYCLGNK